MRRHVCLAALLAALAACQSLPTSSGSFASELDSKSTARMIFDHAKRCWDHPATYWSNGISVGNRVELDGIVIYAGSVRFPNDLYIPLLRVTVGESPAGSTIDVYEAKIGHRDLALTSDIDRWMSGDMTCRDLGY
jgi:hypothetical protein